MTEAQIPLSYTTVHYCWIMSSAEALSKAIYIEFTGQTGSRFDFLKGGAGPVLVWCGQNGFVFAFFFSKRQSTVRARHHITAGIGGKNPLLGNHRMPINSGERAKRKHRQFPGVRGAGLRHLDITHQHRRGLISS
jgi:hypothetical protein